MEWMDKYFDLVSRFKLQRRFFDGYKKKEEILNFRCAIKNWDKAGRTKNAPVLVNFWPRKPKENYFQLFLEECYFGFIRGFIIKVFLQLS